MVDLRESNIWSVYVHIVPKEIRASANSKNYFDKYYVGITSRSIEERWGINGNEYKNQIFYNAIQKYGWENIQHIIVAENLTESEAKAFEIALIKELKSFTEDGRGYNGTRGGDGFLGVKRYGSANSFYGKHHSEETREKMSKHHKYQIGETNSFYGKHHTEETKKLISELHKKRYIEHPETYANRPPMTEERKKQVGLEHSKSVYVFDMELNYLAEYHSVREAAKELGLTERVAHSMANDARKYDKDYIIRFTDQVPDINVFQKTYQVKIQPQKSDLENPIYQFDLEFNYIQKFKNEYEAAKITGIPLSKIRDVFNYIKKDIDGFIFRKASFISDLDKYISVNKKILTLKNPIIIQYDLSNNKLAEYVNINEASKKTNTHFGTISRGCHLDGDNGNYIWRFKGGGYDD